jgi:hypothetical protein
MSSTRSPGLVAIVPCNDLDASEAFYRRLGFQRVDGERYTEYRILADERGGRLHLTSTVEGWVVPERNPFGVYLYSEQVDALASQLRDLIIESPPAPQHKPWGMYEMSLSDPNGTLVRIGWPSEAIIAG